MRHDATVTKREQDAIARRVHDLAYERGERLGREIDSDDEDNIASQVAREFDVSENFVRYLGDLPPT